MSRARRIALGVAVLAIAFFLFFGAAKHSFGDVNPFGEDPYDAVGSFGIQLALFAALLALLRAFRPTALSDDAKGRSALALRAAAVSVLAVAATLAADGVALARFPAAWTSAPRGWVLAAWTAGMALVSGFACWALSRAASESRGAASPRPWRGAVGICLMGVFLLAVYPPAWRAGIAGAVLTALSGMALLFVPVRAAATALFPEPLSGHDGAFDDMGAVLAGLETRSPGLAVVTAPSRSLATRLGSGRRRWPYVLAVAATMGIALVFVEVSGEGLAPDRRRAVLVVLVILLIEGAGVALGYASLGNLLGIFRRDDAS